MAEATMAAPFPLLGAKPSPPPKQRRATHRNSGAQLLLTSAAGATAALGVVAVRWLAAEAGAVLVLLADESSDGAYGASFNDDAAGTLDGPLDGVDVDWHQCVDEGPQQPARVASMGHALVSLASSPHLRMAPLLLLLLSAIALVGGIARTYREIRRFISWMRMMQNYGEEGVRQFLAALGASDAGEGAPTLEATRVQCQTLLQKQMTHAVRGVDTLVLDDVLHQLVTSGAALAAGILGGTVLYALPAERFAANAAEARAVRRRVVHAAAPWLEDLLFRPGGMWGALPGPVRRSLLAAGGEEEASGSRDEAGRGSVGEVQRTTEGGEDTESTDTDDDDSAETPLACPVQVVSVKDRERAICARAARAGAGEDVAIPSSAKGETIAEALSATVTDCIVSNLTGRNDTKGTQPLCLGGGDTSPQEGQRRDERDPPPPPSPLLPLERTLRRTSVAAAVLFLCHLRRSPSARRSWGSAANFVASLGLASAAVGAGAAAGALRANAAACDAMARHPLLAVLWSTVWDASHLRGLPRDMSQRGQWMLDRIRKEIKENRRLRAALAFVVLYGMRSWSTRGPRNIKPRKGIQ